MSKGIRIGDFCLKLSLHEKHGCEGYWNTGGEKW